MSHEWQRASKRGNKGEGVMKLGTHLQSVPRQAQKLMTSAICRGLICLVVQAHIFESSRKNKCSQFQHKSASYGSFV